MVEHLPVRLIIQLLKLVDYLSLQVNEHALSLTYFMCMDIRSRDSSLILKYFPSYREATLNGKNLHLESANSFL